MTIRRGNQIIAGRSLSIPTQTGNTGKFLKTDGTNMSWENVPQPDGTTITDTNNTLIVKGVIDKGSDTPIYNWVGTLAEWTAGDIATLHPDWVCFITDDAVSPSNISFDTITNKPTTLSGYGITDGALDTNVVHTSGAESVGGNKTFTAANTFTSVSTPILFKNSSVEQMTVPSAYSEQMLYCIDKNGVRIANYGGAIDANGNSRSYIAASKLISGDYKYCIFDAYVSTAGARTAYVSADTFDFPKCTSVAGTSSTAASNKVAVIIQNYKNGNTWLRKWSDGWKEQGGFLASTGGSVTLPAAMSYTTYTCIVVHNGNTAKGEGFIHAYNKTTTGFSYGQSYSTSGMAWMSWYVAGY